MNKWIGNLKTITAHKMLVMKYCFKIGLYKQGLLHDMSKYSPSEFLIGVKYYQGNRSPNTAEREDKGLSTSWLHHKGRNKHHIEYWVDYSLDKNKVTEGVDMPDKYICEMFCDKIAASRIYQKEKYTDASPYNYFINSREINLASEYTKNKLISLLEMLKNEGEDKTFKYIRHEILNKKISGK